MVMVERFNSDGITEKYSETALLHTFYLIARSRKTLCEALVLLKCSVSAGNFYD